MPGFKCRLKVLRAEKDMTQEDLAKAVGVTRQTIISIEKGDYVPSLLLGVKLARYFQKPVEEVFLLE
jgi:putative transcriptional regulator